VSAVVVDPRTGRLTADSATLTRLKTLCAEDGAMLADGDARRTSENHPRRAQPISPRAEKVRVAPPPGDDEIEGLLGSLMVTVHGEAMKSFALARDHTQPGQLVEMRDIHIHQGARLVRAFADLIEARRGRREQRIVVQHLTAQSGAKVTVVSNHVGAVNT
jgi:hypothetical protein